jgi:hypothetical protein
MKPVSKTKLMSLLVKLNQLDQELYQFLKPYDRYSDQIEGWYLLSFHNVLNAVYYEFCGESERSYYKQFKTYAGDSENKPVAWYKGSLSLNSDGSIKGPKGFSGYIPDCINDVILSYKLDAKEKLKLLTRMFKDLKRLKSDFGEKVAVA